MFFSQLPYKPFLGVLRFRVQGLGFFSFLPVLPGRQVRCLCCPAQHVTRAKLNNGKHTAEAEKKPDEALEPTDTKPLRQEHFYWDVRCYLKKVLHCCLWAGLRVYDLCQLQVEGFRGLKGLAGFRV